MAQQAVAILRVGPEGLDGAGNVAMQHHPRLRAEIVGQGGSAVEEQRQVVLDAGAGHAASHVLVQGAAAGIALEHLAPARAELLLRRVVERKFAPGQHAHFAHRVEAALSVGVEGLDGVDGVAEQIDAVGHGRTHGMQVDQSAAHRILARGHHLADVVVAGKNELGAQRRFVQGLALAEVEGEGGEEFRRSQSLDGGVGRGDDHVELLVVDGPKRGQAFGNQVLVRRETVVGQGFPVGQQSGAQRGGEPAQFVLQALGIGRLGGDDQPGRGLRGIGLRGAQFGQQQGIGAARRQGPGKTLAGFERRQLAAQGMDNRHC
ncbi:hypothetical protein GALL_483790 [mine drainage metagenome]|uniref:Uncharacterized protein n=1 Tax=mine drainage metagenome TaxID=410659 RepID=A0A1J5PF59_9ZZZZ